MNYEKFPRFLQIETHTRCNATCFICPNDQLTRPDMTTEAFYKIINDCKGKGVQEIHPFFTNEPLMERRLWGFMDYIQGQLPEAGIHLYSNMSLMTLKNAENLLRRDNFKFIAFSLDGASKEIFEKMRPGLNWEKVWTNTKNFLDLRADMGRSDVHTKAVMTLTPDNECDEAAFKRMWSGAVNEVMVMGSDGRARLGNDWQKTQVKSKAYKNDPRWPCRAHRCHTHSMYILSNGDTVPCCKDFDGQTRIGNVLETSVEEVWNSERMNEIRAKLDAGIYDEKACRLCPLWG